GRGRSTWKSINRPGQGSNVTCHRPQMPPTEPMIEAPETGAQPDLPEQLLGVIAAMAELTPAKDAIPPDGALGTAAGRGVPCPVAVASNHSVQSFQHAPTWLAFRYRQDQRRQLVGGSVCPIEPGDLAHGASLGIL